MTGSFLTAGNASAATSYLEGTDAAARVFDPLQVNQFSLQISEQDFDSLIYPNVAWDYEGDWRDTRMSFTMAGKVYGPYRVGIHLKGAWGSWRDVTGKAGFKIKMDAFVKGQNFFGLNVITLNNMIQDNSYSHEAITYRLFRKLGIPSPRVGYANVSLNGRNYGLHLNVETLSKQMLERWGIPSDHLYKGAVPYFPDFYPDSEWKFAVESGSQTDYSDLTKFLQIQTLDGDAWWKEMSKITDMNLLTLGWASEIFTGHWDGYAVNRNNYFINFDKAGKIVLLPWGTDQTWGGGLDYFGAPALLPNKCWAYQPCLETYRQSMAKVARVAKNLELDKMASAVSTSIRSAIVSDPYGPGIQVASQAQSYLQSWINEQQRILQGTVQPWDTTLAKIRVNGTNFDPDSIIYLPSGTKKAYLQATTSQEQARAVLQPAVTLSPGLNRTKVLVTSENGEHINTNYISLYVWTNKLVQTVIPYNKNSEAPTFDGLSETGLFAARLQEAKQLNISIEMVRPVKFTQAKARVLLNSRVRQLITELAKRGIRPVTVTPAFANSGKADSLRVSAKYLK